MRLAGVGMPSAAPLRTTKPFRWSISVGLRRASYRALPANTNAQKNGDKLRLCQSMRPRANNRARGLSSAGQETIPFDVSLARMLVLLTPYA